MDSAALLALSPVDGRYRKSADALRAVLSESGLIRERIRIEAAWLLVLAEAVPDMLPQPLGEPIVKLVSGLALEPGDDAPAAVKTIESRINHDVKAVEYFVREKLASAGAPSGLPGPSGNAVMSTRRPRPIISATCLPVGPLTSAIVVPSVFSPFSAGSTGWL